MFGYKSQNIILGLYCVCLFLIFIEAMGRIEILYANIASCPYYIPGTPCYILLSSFNHEDSAVETLLPLVYDKDIVSEKVSNLTKAHSPEAYFGIINSK